MTLSVFVAIGSILACAISLFMLRRAVRLHKEVTEIQKHTIKLLEVVERIMDESTTSTTE